MVRWGGTCYASVDGREAGYNVGITEDDLTELAKGNSNSVWIAMAISGQCKHIWKKTYGRVSGLSIKEQVDAIADGADKLCPPSWCAKRNIMDLDYTSLFFFDVIKSTCPHLT